MLTKEKKSNITNIYTAKSKCPCLKIARVRHCFPSLSRYSNNSSHFFSGYYVPETKLPTNINSFNSPPTLRICSVYDLIFQLRTLYHRKFSNLSKVPGFMSRGAGIQTQMVWLHSLFAYNLITLPKSYFQDRGMDISGHKETRATKRALHYSLSQGC